MIPLARIAVWALGASAIGFSVAAYFVVLDAFFSHGFFPGKTPCGSW
ncbi:MAG TPA: hypothetical protein VKH20_00075 [Solirubrobacterales bacterium]|nr:hypothetical protein [Solirubrobacterales bacterium]